MLRIRKKLGVRARALLAGGSEKAEIPDSLPGREFDSLDALRRLTEPILGRPLRQADLPHLLEPLVPEPIDADCCDFVFSRNLRRDYHFERWACPDGFGRDEVRRLQDFAPCLTGGQTGYYSFPIRKRNRWMIAKLERTDVPDHVGRPIFRTVGNLFSLEELGSRWVTFALGRLVFPTFDDIAPEPGEYPEGGAEWIERLAGRSHLEKRPLAWGCGLAPKRLDRSRLGIDYRFGVTERADSRS